MIRPRMLLCFFVCFAFFAGCDRGSTVGDAHDDHAHDADGGHADEHDHADEGNWPVTAWGESYEIFAEAQPLIANRASRFFTHVTRLDDFSAVREGVVTVVFRGADGAESVFRRDRVLRAGIFELVALPPSTGDFDLLFRVQTPGGLEEIPAGRVRVGTEDAPGGAIARRDDIDAFEEVDFLKEQQWRTDFATAWADSAEIREVARGTGRVRPAAAGELFLAAPVDGIVVADPWPYLGLSRERDEPVLALRSRVSQGRTLAELQVLDTEKQAELEVARERLARLEGLLEVGAVSAAEVEAARARTRTLEAQSEWARRQMESVRRSRDRSDGAAPVLEVTAPFAGEVAEVLVSPGQAVGAGDPLVRIVRVEPVWVEAHVAPDDAQRMQAGVSGLWVRATGERERTLFDRGEVELVSIAPEVSARTGRVIALLSVDTEVARLRLGSALELEVLLEVAHAGVVVPAGAVVDDAGVPTVYVQRAGETFERREVVLLAREGDRVLVDGVAAGERVVVAGGAAIRRASLVSSGGADHGHVH